MKHQLVVSSLLVLIGAGLLQSCAQTNCVWIEQSRDGYATGKIAVSADLVRALARPGSNFDLDGAQVAYDTLLYVYREGKVLRILDSSGMEESKVYRGSFGLPTKKSSNDKHHVVLEKTDSNGSVSVHKVRVESIEAAAVIISMIKSGSLDKDLDSIESMLKPGGILYLKDLRDGSSVWIYVN